MFAFILTIPLQIVNKLWALYFLITMNANKLFPLNNVCAVADLRVGILTARERWEYIFKENIFINTADYLSVLYEPVPQGLHIWIDANLIPDEYLIGRIFSLAENEALADSKGLIAGRKKFRQ
jgi:hypothetical protein